MTTVAAPVFAAGSWRRPAERGTAGFTVRGAGGRRVSGVVPIVAARVDVDPAGTPESVWAVLDLTGIDTGSVRRDADLQKRHLLDTERHPQLTFEGCAPEPTPDGWRVRGRLTGRADTELTLAAQIIHRSPTGELTVRATTSFDRRGLGIRAPRLMIGRWVDVTIEAVFQPPA
jgi:polyisoprenoid-binding protein YceI